MTPWRAIERLRSLAGQKRLRFGDPEQIALMRVVRLWSEAEQAREALADEISQCPQCKGEGEHQCPICRGNGDCLCCGRECGECGGMGTIECGICGGSGEFKVSLHAEEEEIRDFLEKLFGETESESIMFP